MWNCFKILCQYAKPDCEVDCKQIFLIYYLVFKFNFVQVLINRLTTPSFPRLIKSICTKVKSKKLLKSLTEVKTFSQCFLFLAV